MCTFTYTVWKCGQVQLHLTFHRTTSQNAHYLIPQPSICCFVNMVGQVEVHSQNGESMCVWHVEV